MNTQRRERLQIRLYPRAAAAVRPRDRQRHRQI